MTPRGERSARTCREMERGREMVERATRFDLIDKWEKEKKILSLLEEPAVVAARIVVGDTYIDEPVAQFPSERLIATIALLLQARGEL